MQNVKVNLVDCGITFEKESILRILSDEASFLLARLSREKRRINAERSALQELAATQNH